MAVRLWATTFLATAASAYALDAVATTAGVLLAASALLSGADHAAVLVFLAATYVVWGAGMRVSLTANWTLLEQTGTSTNAVSKAAHDIVRARSASLRARRAASAIGYVGTEIAKEVPYYAGAFGAAVVSESVSSADALVFLGGANLGAAAYEYGLAGVTQLFLRRRSAPYASFDADWVPRDYLADYYSAVEPDEIETIRFFAGAIETASPGEPVLFFGVGPTLHHAFLAAPHVSEIHLGDYLPENLREIRRWLDRDPDAHDWRPFVRYTLECEGVASPTDLQIGMREELTRARITRLLEVDARHAPATPDRYATVVSAYCADSATADRADVGVLHAPHRRPRPARRPVHHLRPTPLRRLPRRRPLVPEREHRRARLAGGAGRRVRRRDGRGARARRARVAGLRRASCSRRRGGPPPHRRAKAAAPARSPAR